MHLHLGFSADKLKEVMGDKELQCHYMVVNDWERCVCISAVMRVPECSCCPACTRHLRLFYKPQSSLVDLRFQSAPDICIFLRRLYQWKEAIEESYEKESSSLIACKRNGEVYVLFWFSVCVCSNARCVSVLMLSSTRTQSMFTVCCMI